MVLQAKLPLKSTVDPDSLSQFSNTFFELTDNQALVPCFEWLDKNAFESELDSMMKWLKKRKNKITGELLVATKEDDNIMQGRYNVRSKLSFENCEIAMTIKKSRPQTKALTDSEKLSLFKEYWEQKKEIPKPSEVFKGFRIGSFYATLIKNESWMEQLQSIMKE